MFRNMDCGSIRVFLSLLEFQTETLPWSRVSLSVLQCTNHKRCFLAVSFPLFKVVFQPCGCWGLAGRVALEHNPHSPFLWSCHPRAPFADSSLSSPPLPGQSCALFPLLLILGGKHSKEFPHSKNCSPNCHL